MAANETVRFSNSVSVPEIKAHFDNSPLSVYPCTDNGNPRKNKNGVTIYRFQIGALPQYDAEGNPLLDEAGLPITKPFMGAVAEAVAKKYDAGESVSADALQVALVSQKQSDGTWSNPVPTLCFANKVEAIATY